VSLLQVETLIAGYGAVDILNGINLSVDPGRISVIVGPNGAGKSTAMKAIFGLAQIREGRVMFQGDEVTRQPADTLVARGIAYVPQERNVFRSLSVRENLEMGAFLKPGDIARRSWSCSRPCARS
jgi:branched-chain amino acid transport system ATP-binding protein